MSHGAHHAPYGRFLNAQDPHERADALRFFFPTCSYNQYRCGAPCGFWPDGRPYSMCDNHRARHRRDEGSSRARRQLLRMMNVDVALGATADPSAIWSDERAFGEELAALLRAPPPSVPAAAPVGFDVIHDEAEDDDGLDGIDSLFELLPPVSDNADHTQAP